MKVLQVLLDQPGGGPSHVSLLSRYVTGFELVTFRWRASRTIPSWTRSVRALRKEITRSGPCLVHAHGVRAATWTMVAMTGSASTKMLATVHGLHSIRRTRGPVREASTRLNRFVLSRFDLVIVLSPSDKHAILERRLALPQRVRMIEPAIEVEPSASGMRSSPPTVLWMARFVEQKDPLAFVRLAAALPGLQAKWVMAGDGPLLNDAKILSRQLSAPISFPGWVQRSHELMGRSDIYVSTSLWEGLPLTLLEAAAAGLAIVATDVAGNSDVARRGEIQLVEAADDHALRTAVHNLVMDNEHRHLRAERTKEALATYFDVTRMASETREVYEELSESAS